MSNTSAIIENLDVSDQERIEIICKLLDKGIKVKVESVHKTNPDFKSKITFMGRKEEQEKGVIVIDAYRHSNDDYLIEIN